MTHAVTREAKAKQLADVDEYIAALEADLRYMRGGPNVQGVRDREWELEGQRKWRALVADLTVLEG